VTAVSIIMANNQYGVKKKKWRGGVSNDQYMAGGMAALRLAVCMLSYAPYNSAHKPGQA